MKYILLILLASTLIGATVTDDEKLKVGQVEFDIIVSDTHDILIMKGPYYETIIRNGKCKGEDVYLFCVENITYSPVQFYPAEHEVEITWEKVCDDCIALGERCDMDDDQCDSGVCVHRTCQPTDPWCGDNQCDEGEEMCYEDCGEPEIEETETNETNSTSNETIPEPIEEENVTNETLPVEETLGEETAEEPEAAPLIDETPEPEEKRVVHRKEEDNGPEYIASGLVVVLGIAAIMFIFNRKRARRAY